MWPEPVQVRIDRLLKYDSCTLTKVCRDLGIPPLTKESLASAKVNDPRKGHDNKHKDHRGRVKFFFVKRKKWETGPILICNGSLVGEPLLDEPHIYDGSHRYLAAVIRDDKTIDVVFRFSRSTSEHLTQPVIDYLTGTTNSKPGR